MGEEVFYHAKNRLTPKCVNMQKMQNEDAKDADE
jgi:hypothetical protein